MDVTKDDFLQILRHLDVPGSEIDNIGENTVACQVTIACDSASSYDFTFSY